MGKIALRIGATLTALMPATALAQSFSVDDDIIGDSEDFEELLETIRNWFFTIFLAVSVIFLILAAFRYLTAGGDDTKLGKAKNNLIYSIVAIFVALLAGSLPSLIRSILG